MVLEDETWQCIVLNKMLILNILSDIPKLLEEYRQIEGSSNRRINKMEEVEGWAEKKNKLG